MNIVFNVLFNDLENIEPSLQLQKVVNMRKQATYKFRRIVSEVSSYVGTD